MTNFFSFADESIHDSDLPCADRIIEGLVMKSDCSQCGAMLRELQGDLKVTMDSTRGSYWPDVLSCGGHPALILSAKFADILQRSSQGLIAIGGAVRIAKSIPMRLERKTMPEYLWIDGSRMFGARLDFEASGIIGNRFCSRCGTRSSDISMPSHRKRLESGGYRFVDSTWNGSDVFVTDLSLCHFFCTEAVVAQARQYHISNCRFVPVAAGDATWSRGIDYLGKAWPPRFRVRPSDGKTVHEWVADLRTPSRSYEARLALLDLGTRAAPAIPALLQMLDDPDETLRREATIVFYGLRRQGVEIGKEGESAAIAYEEWLPKTFGA